MSYVNRHRTTFPGRRCLGRQDCLMRLQLPHRCSACYGIKVPLISCIQVSCAHANRPEPSMALQGQAPWLTQIAMCGMSEGVVCSPMSVKPDGVSRFRTRGKPAKSQSVGGRRMEDEFPEGWGAGSVVEGPAVWISRAHTKAGCGDTYV